MPRINYKPSNWRSGETPRNVITLTGAARFLLLREERPRVRARSRLQISAYRPIDYLRATTNLRPFIPPPAFPSVSKLTRYAKVELPKTGEERGKEGGFRFPVGGIPISACQHGLKWHFRWAQLQFRREHRDKIRARFRSSLLTAPPILALLAPPTISSLPFLPFFFLGLLLSMEIEIR